MSELNDLNLSESSLTKLILDKLCWNCTIFFDPGLPQFSTECGDRRVLPSKIRPHQMHCHSTACKWTYCQIIAYMCYFQLFWNSDKTRWRNSYRLQIQLGHSSSLVQGDFMSTNVLRFIMHWNLYICQLTWKTQFDCKSLQISWAKHQKVVRGLPDWKTALRMANLPNQGGSRLVIMTKVNSGKSWW